MTSGVKSWLGYFTNGARTAWVSSIEDNVTSQSNGIVLCKRVIHQELDFMQDTASVNNDEKRMAVERLDANTASSKGGMFEH